MVNQCQPAVNPSPNAFLPQTELGCEGPGDDSHSLLTRSKLWKLRSSDLGHQVNLSDGRTKAQGILSPTSYCWKKTAKEETD